MSTATDRNEKVNVYCACVVNGKMIVISSRGLFSGSIHAEIGMLNYLRQIRETPTQNKIYVFRIFSEKKESTKFFGSIGKIHNKWFASAHMCWSCHKKISKSFAINFKWLTPSDNGSWESAILENPKPSSGTCKRWFEHGVSEYQLEEIIRHNLMQRLPPLKKDHEKRKTQVRRGRKKPNFLKFD